MERAAEASPFMTQARLAFEYSLSNFIWKQAVFFAERLVAEGPSDETNYLLALAFFHNQETGRAYWRLQGCRLPEARYLLARCCFLLQKWEEAEDALLGGPPASPGNLAEVVNGAAGLYLLGQVKEKQGKREGAIECYAKCLELCPFMWDAYERWSWLILGSPSPSRSSSSSVAASTFSDEKFNHSFANLSTLGGGTWLGLGAPAGGLIAAPGLPQKQATATHWNGGGGNAGRSQNAPPRNDREQQHHAMRKERRTAAEPLRISGSGHAFPSNSIAASAREAKESGSSLPSWKESSKRQNDTAVVGNDGASEITLAALLAKLGTAVHAVHNFESGQTLSCLSSLPRRHYETGFVLDLVGYCHFEAADYKKAEQAFQQVWRIEPRRVEGLEYYSSALWHLRKDIELGHLAQRCLQWDRLKPQVWCVVGNCFSLQNEHDVAIKFFKRAVQVDPSFTYAYTLCGHEFVANEKFDKAIPMYEQALNVDSRHYNAWWGLGNIYHRQEEHENARYHFLKALEINRSNSVLRCYLGMVMESLNNPLMALENFDRASQGEPQNGMAYFQKACVLMTLERYEEALADLKKVRCLAPKEACVHFQLGKVYMKLQRDRKALLHFNIAMDLNRDSKDYHTIKTHIERLHIRGVKEPDIASITNDGRTGRLHSTSSTSTAGEDRERVDGRGADHGGAHTAASAPSRQRSEAFMSQHYGSPTSRAEPSLPNQASATSTGNGGPQTPGVSRGGHVDRMYTGRDRGSLWSGRGQAPSVPSTGTAVGRGNGASSPGSSWSGGTPTGTGGTQHGFRI